MNDEERRSAIETEAKDVLEATTYASETQFEYAKRWRTVDRWVGSVAAALAAVAGVGGLSKFLSIGWAGTIAIASALVGAVSASIAARQTTEKAAVAGNSYRALEQDARMFLSIDLASMLIDDARNQLQELVDRQQQLNREAPLPSEKAWQRAKEQIEGGSQTYETDKQ
ncbi:MAG: SLATT domain-containing protein [Acidimicrobiales bacterium]|nr:SLATT domain-containing protein [Acidimicrobiales bacterium]